MGGGGGMSLEIFDSRICRRAKKKKKRKSSTGVFSPSNFQISNLLNDENPESYMNLRWVTGDQNLLASEVLNSVIFVIVSPRLCLFQRTRLYTEINRPKIREKHSRIAVLTVVIVG